MFVPSLYSFNFRISNLYIYLNFIAFSEKSRRILRKNSFYVDLFG